MEKPSWVPLESNPDAFNQYFEKLGVTGVECVEVYGFESDLLAFIQRPHFGLVFCYPCSDDASNFLKKLYADIETLNKNNVPEDAFFMKQKIENACGTFALLHVLTNNTHKFDIGSGPFANWYRKAKQLGVQERSDSLAANEQMASAHRYCADRGETTAPEADKVEYHFISYLNLNGNLVEFDSAQNFPRKCGSTNEMTFLADAAKQCQLLMSILGNITCNALAIVGKEK